MNFQFEIKNVEFNNPDFNHIVTAQTVTSLMLQCEVINQGVSLPKDSIVRLEIERYQQSGHNIFSVQFLVRFICQSGSWATRIFCCLSTDSDPNPMFFLAKGVGQAKPMEVYKAVFEKALERLPAGQ